MFRTTLPQVYRVGRHLQWMIGLLAGFFVCLALPLGSQRGHWTPLAWTLAGYAALQLLLCRQRLQIDRHGLDYRHLSGSVRLRLADVRAARLEVVRSSKVPQGVPRFVLDLRGGATQPINLRVFPVEAAALLLRQLHHHGIALQVADAGCTRRMAEQIAAADRRLPGAR